MGLSRISRRIDSGSTPHLKHGQWQSAAHPGAKNATHSRYRGWVVEIISRQRGITIKKEVYSAVARSDHPPFHFYCQGRRSKQEAVIAIQRTIDQWHEEHGELMSEDCAEKQRVRQRAKNIFRARRTQTRQVND
jgi:hypothetical protein